jgi:fumarate hydratase, class II
MMPVMGHAALESVRLLASATATLAERCLEGMEASPERCREAVEKSLSMVTGLNPYIGYQQAAALAKEAFASGKTIRELCRERGVLSEDQLEQALDPWRMTKPG